MTQPGLDELRIERGSERPRKRRPRMLVLIAIAAIVTVGIAIAIVLTRSATIEVAEVREARAGEAETVLTAAGYVTSRRRSIVAPKIAGLLVDLLVEEGQRVEQGQVLARLDPSNAEVAVTQAEAGVRAAESQASAARAAAEKAARDVGRAERLFEMGAIARVEADDAQTAVQAAKDQARAAEAQVATAQAALADRRLLLAQTVVRAPFAGTVVRKLADEGSVLAPAAITDVNVGGIVELVDLDALEIDAEVSEAELRNVRSGQPALIVLDALPGVVYRGITGTVRPAIDRAKATAVVKVAFAETYRGALPDMSARVSFLSRELPREELEGEPRLRVPASAVVPRGGRDVVLAVRGGRLSQEPVEIAGQAGNEVTLRRGPPAGTPIAAAPGPRLRAGQRVRVKEAKR